MAQQTLSDAMGGQAAMQAPVRELSKRGAVGQQRARQDTTWWQSRRSFRIVPVARRKARIW